MGTRTAIVPRTGTAFSWAMGVMLILPALAVAEDVVWINELEANSRLIGQEVVVEGRYSGRVGQKLDQIKLRNSKVEFRVSPDMARLLPSTTRFVRVTGTLTESGGKLVMKVKSLSATAVNDAGRYEEAARKIGGTDHAGWQELSERTRRLAEFHGDDELRGLAEQARAKIFHVQEAALKPAQAAELLTLAERVAEAGFEDESRRMKHKALRWQFGALVARAAGPEAWESLAVRIAKVLPGVGAPARSVDRALVNRYAGSDNPIELYDANPEARDAFERELWIAATIRRLLAEAEMPATDLARLADQAKQVLPDRPEVWQQLLGKWADGEAQKLNSLGDKQVHNLVKVLRTDLGKPDRANALLKQWLESKRRQLDRRDVESRYQLAHDYRLELRDDATAVALVTEALKIDSDPVRQPELDELKALGFVKGQRGWVRSDSALNPVPVPEPVVAVLDTLPKPGMSADQVRKLLGEPKPEDILRVGTAGQVVEEWIYRAPPAISIYVVFRVSRTAQLVVLSVHSLGGR